MVNINILIANSNMTLSCHVITVFCATLRILYAIPTVRCARRAYANAIRCGRTQIPNSQSLMQILRIKQLTKQFVLHEQGKVIPAAKPIDLSLEMGKLTALVGTSGVGKSSLLKCIYRTYLPSAGEIFYCDTQNQWIDLATASEYQILELRRSQINFVTQFLDFLPRQSTLDVVAKPLFDLGVDRKEARNKSKAILEQLDIPQRLWKVSPATFSGGEKQRVNIARGLIMRSRLLLLDEPTASLDAEVTKKVIKLIKNIKQQGTAILAVFHEPQIISELADTTVTLQPSNDSHKENFVTSGS